MPTRLWSLFRIVTTPTGRRTYTRVAYAGAYPRATAVRVFQSTLLVGGGAFMLRPTTQVKTDPTPPAHVLCEACSRHTHDTCTGGACACGCRLVRAATTPTTTGSRP